MRKQWPTTLMNFDVEKNEKRAIVRPLKASNSRATNVQHNRSNNKSEST